jgi:hypothetical protein
VPIATVFIHKRPKSKKNLFDNRQSGHSTLAFENGYRDIIHLTNDDLKNVRENSDFKSVVDKWKTTIEEQNKLEFKKQNDKNLKL